VTRRIDILFHLADRSAPEWIDAIGRALPEARLHVWPDDGDVAADYAIVFAPQPGHVAALSRVRAVFNLGAGVNAFWQIPELPTDVPLIRLEDAGMAGQMVEYATYAALRRFREFDFYAVEQRAARWSPRERQDKRAFGIGVLGLGALGLRVAAALRDQGFPVSGWSRTAKEVAGIATHSGPDGLDAMLPSCRLLIALVPLTPATAGLLNRRTLGRLPRGAVVVNVGRGALVVDADLLALLASGHLAGAMLDVFSDEPLPAEHPFWHHPQIEVTPHISAITQRDESAVQIAAKIRALERGETVGGVVDRSRQY